MTVYKPDANFIYCRIPDSACSAPEIARDMFISHNIYIKHCLGKTQPESDRYLRIACRTEEENVKLIKALIEVLERKRYVITSYSIHYTKLYEPLGKIPTYLSLDCVLKVSYQNCAQTICVLPLLKLLSFSIKSWVWICQQKISLRITSYNVCYTKLLRTRPWRTT